MPISLETSQNERKSRLEGIIRRSDNYLEMRYIWVHGPPSLWNSSLSQCQPFSLLGALDRFERFSVASVIQVAQVRNTVPTQEQFY